MKRKFGYFFSALLILIGSGWVAGFVYLRNPVLLAGTHLTGGISIDPEHLAADVRVLAELAPNRSHQHPEAMIFSRDFIAERFRNLGYEVELQEIPVGDVVHHNVVARYGPSSPEVIVIGAHYDACGADNPGADDNASGVAGLLEIARLLALEKPNLPHGVELVAFTLEEPPFFRTEHMGSVHHARKIRDEGRRVLLMLSLEMIGYFSDEVGSQKYNLGPLYALYPWTGNFIGLIGNTNHRRLQRDVKRHMIGNSHVPVYSISAPPGIPGVDFSDHRSYWAHGWPAFMVTDTAFLRNDQYHKPGDTPERLDYRRMAEVVRGVYGAIKASTEYSP